MSNTPNLPMQVYAPVPQGMQPGRNVLTPQDEADKKEIERLRAVSDMWNMYAPDWALYLSAYEGGRQFCSDENLFKHTRENQDDFEDRVERSHYLNYCDVLVDFFTNFIFAETIQRDGGKNQAFYNNWKEDVNRKGETITDFMKQVSDAKQIFGHVYVLVDAPPRPDIATMTVADERELGLDPYLVLINPDEIIDWVVDNFDNFSYAKRKALIYEMEGNEKKSFEQYTEWFPTHVDTSYIDVTDPTKPKLRRDKGMTAANEVGIVPIAVVRFKRSKAFPFMGNSFLRDLAFNNREIMNITSLIQEFLYRQCFNMLAKEVENAIPLRDQSDGDAGSSNVVEIPKGAQMPEYLSPPADPAQFLQSERSFIKQEMFRRAAQDTMTELMNGEKASGFSQAQSFSKTVPFIANRADTLERAEHRIMDLVMRYKGTQWDGKIKYKDRYELTNLTDQMTQLQILGRDLQLPSPTFFKEEMKRLVDEYDGKLTVDTRNKILAEIDKLDFTQWQDIQKQALIGQPKAEGTSPGAQQKPKGTGTMAEAQAEATQVKTASTKKVKS